MSRKGPLSGSSVTGARAELSNAQSGTRQTYRFVTSQEAYMRAFQKKYGDAIATPLAGNAATSRPGSILASAEATTLNRQDITKFGASYFFEARVRPAFERPWSVRRT